MPRPRDRKSAAGLLLRMESRPWKDGKTVSYRYHPLGGKPTAWSTDRDAVIRMVLDANGQTDGHGTLRWVWEQYQTAARWLKLADVTRADYKAAWRAIDAVLGGMLIADITSPIVARYVHVERAAAPRRADIEKSLMSRLFGHGIKLGVCEVNATIGVEPHGSEPRSNAPNVAELQALLAWLEHQTPQRRILGMMAEYASLTGSRRVEFLDLSWPQIDLAAGIVRTKRAKQRGARRGEVIELVEITPKLRALIDRLAAVRAQRGIDCLHVFPSRFNAPYNDRGFKTGWQRLIAAARADSVITKANAFTFHDLRAHYTTVHKQERNTLPALHANEGTTARVYDRNREVKRRAL